MTRNFQKSHFKNWRKQKTNLLFRCIFQVNVERVQSNLRHSYSFVQHSIGSTCFGPVKRTIKPFWDYTYHIKCIKFIGQIWYEYVYTREKEKNHFFGYCENVWAKFFSLVKTPTWFQYWVSSTQLVDFDVHFKVIGWISSWRTGDSRQQQINKQQQPPQKNPKQNMSDCLKSLVPIKYITNTTNLFQHWRFGEPSGSGCKFTSGNNRYINPTRTQFLTQTCCQAFNSSLGGTLSTTNWSWNTSQC